MDDSQKSLLRTGLVLFAIVTAGVWIYSWVSPSDEYQYTPQETVVEAESNPGNESNSYYIDPCADQVTSDAYQSCLDDQALEDWHDDRAGEAGLP